MTSPSEERPPLSIPIRSSAARALTETELNTIERVADALIPSTITAPAASAEPGFHQQLVIALDARDDAFDGIVGVLERLGDVSAPAMYERLRRLDVDEPATFQALSTVVAGAWLLTPGVGERIGYGGLSGNPARLEDAADELASGILDPVVERYAEGSSVWIR